MRSPAERRSLLFVVILAALLYAPVAIFTITHFSLPHDGLQIVGVEQLPTGPVAVVRPVVPDHPIGSAVFVGEIAGRPLSDWLFAGDSPPLQAGVPISYAALGPAEKIIVSVTLQRGGRGQLLVDHWSDFLFLAYLALVSTLVFIRRPYLPSAQQFFLVSATVIASGVVFYLGIQPADFLRSWRVALWLWSVVPLYGFLLGAILHFAFLFPRPHPAILNHPWLVMPIYGGVWIPFLLYAVFLQPYDRSPLTLIFFLADATVVMNLVYLPLIVVSTWLHYRQLPSNTHRRQTRWVLWGLLVAVLPWLSLLIIRATVLPSADETDWWIGFVRWAIPTAFAISILRERLFDIDVIINRTLVYSLLTAILALVYFAAVISLQALFRGFTGQNSSLAIVLSTLAIAALFSPLRSRIQLFIDRRFYRQKYDAAQALARFAAAARDEVDLDQLTAELIRIVKETVQPSHVTLWFKEKPAETVDRDRRSRLQ